MQIQDGTAIDLNERNIILLRNCLDNTDICALFGQGSSQEQEAYLKRNSI